MKLKRSVERHLSLPHRFVCLTDDPAAVDCETLPIPMKLPGWWGKLALFSDLIEGRILFIDLDTVLVGNIDDFTRYGGELAIIRPFYRNRGFASGVMNIGPGAHPHVWERFSANPLRAVGYCRQNAVPEWNFGDQRWLELQVDKADYWQDITPGQLVSYKVHCRDGIPDNARIVCFHGKPDPHELDEPWLRENWV